MLVEAEEQSKRHDADMCASGWGLISGVWMAPIKHGQPLFIVLAHFLCTRRAPICIGSQQGTEKAMAEPKPSSPPASS